MDEFLTQNLDWINIQLTTIEYILPEIMQNNLHCIILMHTFYFIFKELSKKLEATSIKDSEQLQSDTGTEECD